MEFPKLNIDKRFTTNGKPSQILEANTVKMHVYNQTFLKAFATQLDIYNDDAAARLGGLADGNWYIDTYGVVHIVNDIVTTGPKSYIVGLTQTAVAAPVADTTFVDETVAGVVIARTAVGKYNLTSTDFVPDKVYISGVTDFAGTSTTVNTVFDGAAITGYWAIYLTVADDVTINLDFYDDTFTPVDMVTLFGTSVFSLPEIKMYA